jgi:chromosome segregation ATPase
MTDINEDLAVLQLINERLKERKTKEMACDESDQLTSVEKELIKRIRLEKCNYPDEGWVDGVSVTMSHDEYNKMKSTINVCVEQYKIIKSQLDFLSSTFDAVHRRFNKLEQEFSDFTRLTKVEESKVVIDDQVENDIEALKVELNKSSNEYYLLKAENERYKISDEHNRNTIDRLDKDLEIVQEQYSVLHIKLNEKNSQNELLKHSLNDKDKIIELLARNQDLNDRLVEVCDE